jgi:hypothetical protein
MGEKKIWRPYDPLGNAGEWESNVLTRARVY